MLDLLHGRDTELTRLQMVRTKPLPFPPELEAVGFDRDVGPFPRTPLDVGVATTIEHFRASG